MRAIFTLFLLFSFLITDAQKDVHDPFPTPRGEFPVDPMESVNSGRSSNTVIAQDFQSVNIPNLPSGWTSLSPEGNFTTGDAKDANAGGYFPVPDIPGNIFAMANDDICNCDMSNIRLISPSFDLSGLSGVDMVLRFNAYHDQNWGGGDATAQISSDGGSTWDTLKVLNSATGWQYYVLDISAYTGNSNVKLKFQWSDAGTWASGFAVDNIVVDELLNNDLRVEKVWTSEMNKDLDHTVLPLAQADTMTVGSRIKNNGRDLQTKTRAAAEITRQGQTLHRDTSSSNSLDSMQRSEYWVETSFVPDSLGYHVVEMEALSDQAEEYPADNLMKDSVRLSCHRFARDRGNYTGRSIGGGLYSNGEGIGYQAGNLFGIQKDAEATGIRFLLDSASEAGARIRGVLYKLDSNTNSFDTVSATNAYSIKSSDVSSLSNPKWTDLRFDSSLKLDSGAYYLATFSLEDSSGAEAELGTSGIVPHNTSYFKRDTSSAWTDVNATPMVRLTTPDFQVQLPEDTAICGDTSMTLDAGSGDSYTWSTGDNGQKITVDTAGTYSVTVTKGQCQTTDSVMVDTTSSFKIGLPTDTVVCEDSALVLDAGGGDSYDWSTGDSGRTIEVGGPASYSVTVTKGACQASDTVQVDTSSKFRIGIPEDTLVCEDSTLTLDAGPGDSYDWSTGKKSRTIEVGGPASYSVTVERGACSSSDTVQVDTVGNCATSLEAFGKKGELKLSPNPAREELNLKKPSSLKIRSIRILDLQGRRVKGFGADRQRLDIEELPEGIYLLRVRTQDGVRVKRFVKE